MWTDIFKTTIEGVSDHRNTPVSLRHHRMPQKPPSSMVSPTSTLCIPASMMRKYSYTPSISSPLMAMTFADCPCPYARQT